MTFEYTLLAGVNDSAAHAEELAALLRRHDLRSHVNAIPWNPVDESGEGQRGRGEPPVATQRAREGCVIAGLS